MTASMHKYKPAELIWDARQIPISKTFDDPYFSFQNGVLESEYVFLKGNQLPQRFEDGFHIGELGFGTGLNFFLSWKAWEDHASSGKIHFTSFEAYPISTQERLRALGSFKILQPQIQIFTQEFDGTYFENDRIQLEIIQGDARQELPRWTKKADAWYLDGFSPAKNPELWGEKLLASVFQKTEEAGSFATYSAAGFVRRNLENAGFQVERIKGFGHKRHMLRGVKSQGVAQAGE